MEKALEKWVDIWDECGFPPRLYLFKAVAAQLAERRAEEEVDLDPSLAELGPSQSSPGIFHQIFCGLRLPASSCKQPYLNQRLLPETR